MRCIDCGRTLYRSEGRGLCSTCRSRHRGRGTLLDFERPSRSAEEVVEDWLILRDQGHDRRQAAARMGMTHHALEQALRRAVKRGLLTSRKAQSFRWLEKRRAA